MGGRTISSVLVSYRARKSWHTMRNIHIAFWE